MLAAARYEGAWTEEAATGEVAEGRDSLCAGRLLVVGEEDEH